MSVRLVEAASKALASRTSRRGFLRRMAIAGSAVMTAPLTYLLRPVTAYAAVVPDDCSTNSRCNSWTELCCKVHGTNTCPPGSVVGGWWRAEGDDDFCGGGSRYFMDCHPASCGGCSCGGSGTCGNGCVNCDCHCHDDTCNNWRTCCTRFRYGQCNQQIDCIGPIICRVVTCVPPFEWDSTCTNEDAREDATRTHFAACLVTDSSVGADRARPGVVRGNTWLLKEGTSSSAPVTQFTYGLAEDTPLAADWTGAGVATAGVVRGSRHGISGSGPTWYLRQIEGAGDPDLIVPYGSPGDIPVVGDWNGEGVETIGVVRGTRWLLRNNNSPGTAAIDFTCSFCQPGDIPVVGDWNGDGVDGYGVVRGTRWLLRNSLSAGSADFDFTFGDAGDIPVVGDWDADGVDTPGRFDDGTWRVSNEVDGSGTLLTFTHGQTGDRPVVWHRLER